ncbi:uncharacterized protein Obp49a [Eurosta solidaginis]|uniref:uncharacterized protein Obp49a n=1 Tax=Eurosta solidaginis TaxID=178769 RepID=UPI003530582A
MKANIVYVTAIYAFGCYLSAAGADFDCMLPPRHVPIHMCCQLPNFISDDVIEQCIQFAGPRRTLPPMTKEKFMPPRTNLGSGIPAPPNSARKYGLPPAPPCLADCIFNKTELMSENSELNQMKFDEMVDEALRDNPEMATVAKASFATCANKLDEMKDKIAEKLNERRELTKIPSTRGRLNPICAPVASMIWGCVNIETFKNCPSSAWNDNEDCNASRDFFKECKKE